jgi:hypothetical protein
MGISRSGRVFIAGAERETLSDWLWSGLQSGSFGNDVSESSSWRWRWQFWQAKWCWRTTEWQKCQICLPPWQTYHSSPRLASFRQGQIVWDRVGSYRLEPFLTGGKLRGIIGFAQDLSLTSQVKPNSCPSELCCRFMGIQFRRSRFAKHEQGRDGWCIIADAMPPPYSRGGSLKLVRPCRFEEAIRFVHDSIVGVSFTARTAKLTRIH